MHHKALNAYNFINREAQAVSAKSTCARYFAPLSLLASARLALQV